MNHLIDENSIPFRGSCLIEQLPFQSLLPFIHKKSLFQLHWGLDIKDPHAEIIFKRLILKNAQKNMIHAEAIYGYYFCRAEENDLLIYADKNNSEIYGRLSFPRQTRGKKLCLADYFSKDKLDVVAFQLVTVGQHASDQVHALYETEQYQDYLYWRGLLAETAEAAASFIHQRIQNEIGVPDQGARYAFGYPPCPKLSDQRFILDLLKADRIQVHLNDHFQLIPEESTCAIVVFHPDARYFFV